MTTLLRFPVFRFPTHQPVHGACHPASGSRQPVGVDAIVDRRKELAA